jgi:RNA polymerase-binding protein DksA
MSALTKPRLKEIESLLSQREKVLQAEVRDAHEAEAARPSAQGPQVDDEVAQGEQRFRHGIEHAELQRDQEELRDIDAARERIAAGRYGQCIDCGADIAFERLKAQPTAARCVACQTRYEKTHDAAPRYMT